MSTSNVSMLSQIQVDRPETDLAAEFKKAAAGAPQRQDVSFDGRIQPQDYAQKSAPVVDAESVAEAVATIVSFAEGLGRSLAISVDDRSGDFVVKVQNASTEEFVRQIPSEGCSRFPPPSKSRLPIWSSWAKRAPEDYFWRP